MTNNTYPLLARHTITCREKFCDTDCCLCCEDDPDLEGCDCDCDEDDCVLFTLARGEIASSRGAAPRPAGGPGGGAAAPAREGEATDDGEAAYTFFSQE